ncbi:clustered mitochondria-domain-containing protein [Echria macrotheca]|uniref:Clustered mitochondria-domain-containing protein n=1 Tax=Echria macrotheca TaxID=438768 RepID=A0AAJ0B578_9PEZI|nr:clustered mitochondria-domain-containing protein [Echria macrotheca]
MAAETPAITSEQKPVDEAPPAQENGTTQPSGDGTEEGAEQVDEAPFTVRIVFPDGDEYLELPVSPLEQIHEIRQSIMEHPIGQPYTCFHLEHGGKRLNDFIQVSDVPDLGDKSKLVVVQDPYTEKEARVHMLRIREIIGAAGNRTDSVYGVLSGISVYDDVVAEAEAASDAKAEIPEYKFEAAPPLSLLLPKEKEPAPKTVDSIELSAWNPPPAHWRLRGHLLYLAISTIDGPRFHITAYAGGFYVNNCTPTKFDPTRKTAPKTIEHHSLIGLLKEISPKFEAAFQQLHEFNGRRDPLTTYPIGNILPVAPWIVPRETSQSLKHEPDCTRQQEPYLLSGVDNTDSLRDWNEEFQSAKELPKDNIQDRVFRERLISKLFADYNEAATRGAVLVARGDVAPLNPTEERDAQIFVYNNVFFSFGADGVGTFTSEGGDEAARVATGKDVLGVKMVNQLDTDGLYTPGTVVVDYLGKRIVGQSIVPGIFKQPEPGENQIRYGAVDGKEQVAADESFAPSFKKLAKSLQVKPHAVWDKDNKRFDLEASVEMKGLLGTDGRKYVLDLYRITPLDIAWMEEEGPDGAEYPHRMTVLRPELVEAIRKQKARDYMAAELARIAANKEKAKEANDAPADTDAEKSDDKKDGDKAAPEESLDMSNFQFALNPDVFSGQVPQTDDEKAEVARDEQEVRDACQYLRDVVMKGLMHELKESDISFPMDGRSLTKLLHRRGINMRYLGHLAKLAKQEDNRLHCFLDLCIREMVSRSFKHVANRYLKSLPVEFAANCCSHLLNCLFRESIFAEHKPAVLYTHGRGDLKALHPDADFSFEDVTPWSIRSAIQDEITRRYRYTLSPIDLEFHVEICKTQLLREIALKLGLQLSDTVRAGSPNTEPNHVQTTDNGQTATGAKKGKNKRGSPSRAPETAAQIGTVVSPDDIINIVPIVKDSAPRSALAEEALEGGRLSIYQGQRKLGEDLLLESLSLHEQIYGLIHPEVAQMYHTLSQVYYQMDQKDAAVELARKAAMVSERTMGVDSAETVLNYLNLSLFLHQRGDSKQALIYARHALDTWKVIYGQGHPDTITTMNNYAVMLQSLKSYHESRLWFEESLKVCNLVYGRSVNSATLHFQLAQALALDNESKKAVDEMRTSFQIFKEKLGENDKNTKEAEHWLEQLTSNAVNIRKQEGRSGTRTRLPGQGFSGGVTGASVEPVMKEVRPTGPDQRNIDDLVREIEASGGGKSHGSSGGSRNKKRTGRANPKRRGSTALRTGA